MLIELMLIIWVALFILAACSVVFGWYGMNRLHKFVIKEYPHLIEEAKPKLPFATVSYTVSLYRFLSRRLYMKTNDIEFQKRCDFYRKWQKSSDILAHLMFVLGVVLIIARDFL